MKDAQCRAVFGRRGSGKTTRVKALIRNARRVVVFDPMDEYAGAGFFPCRTLAALRDRIIADWPGGSRITYIPSGDHARMLHGLMDLIWAAQATARQKITVVVEEMNLGYPARPLPARLIGMQRAVLQGRHRGIEIIGVSQRPALVSMDFRSNCAETYVFPLGAGPDIQAICEVHGREHAAAIKKLVAHTYLRFSDGKVKQGRNTRPRK